MWWDNDAEALDQICDALNAYTKTNPEKYFPGPWNDQDLYALDEQLWAEMMLIK